MKLSGKAPSILCIVLVSLSVVGVFYSFLSSYLDMKREILEISKINDENRTEWKKFTDDIKQRVDSHQMVLQQPYIMDVYSDPTKSKDQSKEIGQCVYLSKKYEGTPIWMLQNSWGEKRDLSYGFISDRDTIDKKEELKKPSKWLINRVGVKYDSTATINRFGPGSWIVVECTILHKTEKGIPWRLASYWRTLVVLGYLTAEDAAKCGYTIPERYLICRVNDSSNLEDGMPEYMLIDRWDLRSSNLVIGTKGDLAPIPSPIK